MASVYGSQPRHFIVDTAAGGSVIDNGWADELKLTAPDSGVTTEVAGASGSRSGIPIGYAERFSLGNIERKGQRFVRVATRQFSRDFGFAGILGNDVTGEFALTFDVPGQRLILEDQQRSSLAKGAECLASADPARMAALKNFAVVPVTLRMADRRSAELLAIIDTGAPGSFINAKAAEALALADADFIGDGPAAGGVNAGQKTATRKLRMAQTMLGTWTIKDLELTLADFPVFRATGYDTRPAMIIGMNILARRAFAIDRNGQGFCLLGKA